MENVSISSIALTVISSDDVKQTHRLQRKSELSRRNVADLHLINSITHYVPKSSAIRPENERKETCFRVGSIYL